MPIRAERVALYPPDWAEISARVRERADWRCEECGVRNRDWGWRDDEGKFHPEAREAFGRDHGRPPFWFGTRRIIEIVLTVAHLDHDETHNDLSNLRAWCQRCHLRYDAKHHAKNARATRRKQMQTEEMFDAE